MNVFYPVEGTTLPIPFDTFAGATGASITASGLAVTDIEILKGTGATARASDNGYSLIDTDGIDIASMTGIHGVAIDLADNSDSGFYAVDSWYRVVISAITVDSQTVSFTACVFRIVSTTRGLAGTALPAAAADAAGGLPISDAGGLPMDDILADTNELQGDWTNGGRLDLLIDAIKLVTDALPDSGALTSLATAAALATAQADLDLLTGADGATLATSQPNYAPAVAGDAMTLTSGERDAIAAALLDLANGIEAGMTLRQVQRATGAILAGIVTGEPGLGVYEAIGNPGTTRVETESDGNGNRTSITFSV